MVDVKHQQRRLLGLGGLQKARGQFVKAPSVGNFGERVDVGQITQAAFGRLVFQLRAFLCRDQTEVEHAQAQAARQKRQRQRNVLCTDAPQGIGLRSVQARANTQQHRINTANKCQKLQCRAVAEIFKASHQNGRIGIQAGGRDTSDSALHIALAGSAPKRQPSQKRQAQ